MTDQATPEETPLNILTINPGDRLIALTAGSGQQAAHSRRSSNFAVGEELEVTAVFPASGYINVRRDAAYSPNPVFRVRPKDVRPVREGEIRQIGVPPEGGLSPDDPRLLWLWEDAERLAKRKGLCGQYDKFTDELGIPGRLRSFEVTHELPSYEDGEPLGISAKIVARSRAEAARILAGRLGKPDTA